MVPGDLVHREQPPLFVPSTIFGIPLYRTLHLDDEIPTNNDAGWVLYEEPAIVISILRLSSDDALYYMLGLKSVGWAIVHGDPVMWHVHETFNV
jgi:hypothetical protein